jgi:hypothetical protein
MINEDLAGKFEMCRAAAETAKARVRLWEDWADTEREAHAKGGN